MHPGRVEWKPTTLIASAFSLMRRHKALTAAIVAACGTALLLPPTLPAIVRLVMSWDVLAVVFLAFAWSGMFRAREQQIPAQTQRYWVGDLAILWLCLSAVAASLIVDIEVERGAVGLPPDIKHLRVALAVATVAISWFFMHTVLALHYAYTYFIPNADTGGPSGGLEFPGGKSPDYFDFLYFSFVIGAAAQTADVVVTSRPIRRIALLHGTMTFVFNTVLLALTINAALM